MAFILFDYIDSISMTCVRAEVLLGKYWREYLWLKQSWDSYFAVQNSSSGNGLKQKCHKVMLEFKRDLGNQYTKNFDFRLLILLNGNTRFLQCEFKLP